MDEGIRPLPEKTEVFEVLTPPTSINDIHNFPGLTGYYHKFIPLYADMTKLLTIYYARRLPLYGQENLANLDKNGMLCKSVIIHGFPYEVTLIPKQFTYIIVVKFHSSKGQQGTIHTVEAI